VYICAKSVISVALMNLMKTDEVIFHTVTILNSFQKKVHYAA
jgi:hypothetical protein